MNELKPVEYHGLEVPIGRGKLVLAAPKDLDDYEFKLVEKFINVWKKYYKRKMRKVDKPCKED